MELGVKRKFLVKFRKGGGGGGKNGYGGSGWESKVQGDSIIT